MSTIARNPDQVRSRGGTKVVLITGVIAVVSFVTGPLLFPMAAEAPTPTSAQLPFFIGLAGLESVILGAGVAFAIFGRSAVQRLFTTAPRARLVHLAVTWWLVSWWPHDNLHMVNGMNLTGLLLIEYVFHVTLILTAAAVAWTLVAENRDATV